MASLDLDRLWKIWMLAIGASEGESIAACARAEAMVRPFGYALADIPALLAAHHARAPDIDIASIVPRELGRRAQRQAAAKAEAERAAAQQRARPAPPPRQPPPERPARPANPPQPREQATHPAPDQPWRDRHGADVEAIIRRHGGMARVFEKTPEELALFNAVLPWHEISTSRDAPGVQEERWDGQSAFRDPTPRVRDALSATLPLPRTIDDAIAEVRRWIRLNHERSLVARYRDHKAPDWDFIAGPVHMRASIVRGLAARSLAARSLGEVIARVRFQLEHDMQGTQESEAVLHDLQALQAHLTATPKAEAAKSARPSARRERRDAVARLLATAEGKAMSTRQVAERTGVTAKTVQSVMREMEQSALLI